MMGGGRKRSLRNGRMQDFFPTTKKARKTTAAELATFTSTAATNPQAEALASRIQQEAKSVAVQPTYLTRDGRSWFLHVKGWHPTPSKDAFDSEWKLRPTTRHSLQVFGRSVQEKRWSQSWGVSYAYSGAVNSARPLTESPTIVSLLQRVNRWFVPENDEKNETTTTSNKSTTTTSNNNILSEEGGASGPYNGCLQNWYTPQDTIGLHADDERSMNNQYPIVSLSWGGTRRFLLRPKPNKNNNIDPAVVELYLEDGGLLLMGGTCQETHKHEVPTHRITKDPPTANRINWTFRAFKT